MKIKVCGISDANFAVAAERLGVDYLGFIFEPSSPRFVTVEKAAEIARHLTGVAQCVGVFVHGTPAEIVAAMKMTSLNVVQLHRRATAEDVAAIKAAGYEVWTLAGGAEGDGILYDSSHGDGEAWLGGTMRRANSDGNSAPKLIIAGGIGAHNIAEAVATGADIIDINSAIEISHSVKSIDLLRAVFKALPQRP